MDTSATATRMPSMTHGQGGLGSMQAGSSMAGGQSGAGMHSQESRPEHTEGTVARMIEEQTAKLPSDLFLWAAVGSIGVSIALHAADRKHDSLFVGQWVPTFLILGLYNKLVKIAGSDNMSHTGH